MKLTKEDKKLIESAKEIIIKSKPVKLIDTGDVGAALITSKGNIFSGISMGFYCGIGSCGEYQAVGSMISNGEKVIDTIVAISLNGNIMPPCGKCREMMLQADRKNRNTWVIVSIVFNKTGNQIFGRLDGTTSTTVDAYNLSMDTTATDVRMMRNRGGVHLDGRMAEYFHVAGAPGTGSTDISDVQKAEGYLAHKWGLEGNLPVSHPYKSSAP